MGAIKNKTVLPRTLLRNGKRSRVEFTASQARHQVIPRPTVLHQSCDTLNASHLSEPDTPMINVPDDSATTAFRSTVVSDISSLKSSVDSLREDIQLLKGRLNKDPSAVDDCDTCLLYVRLKNSTEETLNEVLLESKLNTKILGYDIIRTAPTPAFRIKIAKALLHNALTHARAHDCVADIGTIWP